MKPKSIAIVGAAETTELGRIPGLSQIGLHADAALNAMQDCGLTPKDIDGIATAGETPTTVAHYLGLTPRWVDGTAVGGLIEAAVHLGVVGGHRAHIGGGDHQHPPVSKEILFAVAAAAQQP